ncbi:MAG: (2Fe-2S)-binding protein [Elusimicrobiota bacterium]
MKTIKLDNEGFLKVNFRLNSKDISVLVKPNESLLDVIRRLGYKGAKRGCDTGDCGSCAVILGGKAILSCIIPAFLADGEDILTIEGLGNVLNPHPIQEAFAESGAVQCGYCIPGIIMSTKFLLDRIPDPDEKDIKHHLDGNLCRCTGYVKQIEAVKMAASRLKNNKKNKE